jgi:hypothetical protein
MTAHPTHGIHIHEKTDHIPESLNFGASNALALCFYAYLSRNHRSVHHSFGRLFGDPGVLILYLQRLGESQA